MKSSGILPSFKIAWNVISILTGTQIINAMWLKWNIGKPLFHPIKERDPLNDGSKKWWWYSSLEKANQAFSFKHEQQTIFQIFISVMIASETSIIL